MKPKRIVVELYRSSFDISKEKLLQLFATAEEQGLTDVVVETQPYYGEYELVITGRRMETEEETKARYEKITNAVKSTKDRERALEQKLKALVAGQDFINE